jgi:DHA1 family multidrug resistance protein-like MFS transporter
VASGAELTSSSAVVYSTAFATELVYGLLSIVLPLYYQSVGITITMIGIIISGYAIAEIIFKISAGYLVSRIHPRRLLLIGISSFAATPSLYLTSRDIAYQFTVRFLNGLAAALFWPVLLAFVVRDAKSKNENVARFTMWESIGLSIGTLLAGPLLQFEGASVPLYISGFCMLIPLFLVTRSYTQLSETGLGSQRYGSPSPGISKPALRGRTLGYWFMPVVYMVGIANMLVYVPLFAHNAGIDPSWISLALTGQVIAKIVLQIPAGRLSARSGSKPVVLVGLLFMSFSFLGINYFGGSEVGLLTIMILLGIGTGLTYPPMISLFSDLSSNKTAIMGVYGTISDAGFVAGPWLTSLLLISISNNVEVAFALSSVVMLLPVVLIVSGSLAGKMGKMQL